jgi:hypothetical protein
MEGGGGIAKGLADIVFGLGGGIGLVAESRGEAGMNGSSFFGQEIGPGFSFGIGETSPDEMIELMRDDVEKVWSMG